MRILSKKALKFHHPKDYGITASVPMQYFGTVPDWVADSAMFKLATSDGTVEVIENRQDEIKAETGADTGSDKPSSNRGNRRGGNRGNTTDDNSGDDGNGDESAEPADQSGAENDANATPVV